MEQHQRIHRQPVTDPDFHGAASAEHRRRRPESTSVSANSSWPVLDAPLLLSSSRCRRSPLQSLRRHRPTRFSEPQTLTKNRSSRSQDAAEEHFSRAPDADEEHLFRATSNSQSEKGFPPHIRQRRTFNQKFSFGAPEIRREAEGGCNMVHKDA
jgi:hypothetical protein